VRSGYRAELPGTLRGYDRWGTTVLGVLPADLARRIEHDGSLRPVPVEYPPKAYEPSGEGGYSKRPAGTGRRHPRWLTARQLNRIAHGVAFYGQRRQGRKLRSVALYCIDGGAS